MPRPLRQDVREALEEAGWEVRQLVRVDSAGDAGTGGIEALFVGPGGRAMRATIVFRGSAMPIEVDVRDGWALDQVEVAA